MGLGLGAQRLSLGSPTSLLVSLGESLNHSGPQLEKERGEEEALLSCEHPIKGLGVG